eukprot:6212149-Pleurochrysis_carterae.AAC.2
MTKGAGSRSATQAAFIALAISGSYFWSYCNMMSERMATFELQANMERLQNEVLQQREHSDNGHAHKFSELLTAFETLHTNFENLRNEVQEQRKWLDTLATAELQTNMERLQDEVFQHREHFDNGHNQKFTEFQTAFETLHTNFEQLRHSVLEQRKWLDTQQLELAQLQTQRPPSEAFGILSAAKLPSNESLTQVESVPKYSQPPSFRKTATSNKARPVQRKLLQDMTEDRAMIRVDAPEGFSQFIMGAESAADNVIMEKQHLDDGGEFVLSRNETQALGIDVDGGVTIHSDPLNVASTVQSISGNRLTMRSTETIHMQTVTTHTVSEIDGQGRWSSAALKINVGDTVKWTWTNYHNVIETDEAG